MKNSIDLIGSGEQKTSVLTKEEKEEMSSWVKCDQAKLDCFKCWNGFCKILRDTKFRNKNGTVRQCPFYK